jgi:glycosyltransferase involved in cell wall biosynthesis
MIKEEGVIKLLFLLPTFTFGGAERTSLNLLKGIDKNRFRIHLATSRNIYQYFERIEIEKFIAIEDLGLDAWFKSLKRFLSDVLKVASLLKTEKPDLAFGMMHYPSSLLVFAKKLYNLKVKIIVSPRGPSTEYLRHFEHKFLRKVYLKWIFGFFCRYADGIVVSSTGMKKECISDYHAIPDRVEIIPNSIDINDIKIKAEEEIDLDMPAEFKYIATSGRLEREKNIPILLKAFSELRRKEKIKLLVIGDGSERKNLEMLSHELDIREDVIFVGYQNNPYKFIRRSDIFVHTCLFEGFANVIIEAMACKVPVVAVNCPHGPRDIIKHEGNGFLVPMDDEKALIDVLLMLANNKELRDFIAKRGFERAMDFSVKKMVDGYQSFFYKIIHTNT